MFKDKNILVTGGSGMIGRQLVTLLLNEDANIHVADLNKPINMSKNIIFHNIDLKQFIVASKPSSMSIDGRQFNFETA